MPIYEYRCENGHQFEVMQSMSADPVTKCEVCGASVQRVFHPIAVHFKGSGFYNTDYGKQKRAGGGGGSDESSGSSDSSSNSTSKESKSDGGGDGAKTKKAETPAPSTSSTSSSSSSSSSD